MTGRLVEAVRRGSGVLAGRFGAWLLPGAVGETVVRWLALLFGAFFVLGTALAAPLTIVPVLAVWWCIAAGRTGRQLLRQEAAEVAFVELLRDAIGDRNGVLLADVLRLLHREQLLLDWDVSDVRARCAELGIPVRDSLKVAGSVSVGVHVTDLTAVWDVGLTPPPVIDNPSPSGISAGDYPTTPEGPPTPEGVTWAVHELGDDTLAMLREVS